MKLQELFEGLFEGIEKQHPIPFESPELSMNHKDRMARAKFLGFDVNNIYYHGTVHDFENFDPRLSNSRTQTDVPSGTIYLTSNPAISASYAGENITTWGDVTDYNHGSNIMPLYVKKGKAMIINARGSNWNDIYIKNYPDFETTNDFAEYAQHKGKDSLIIKNVVDSGTWVHKNNRSKRISDVVVIFKPENVRSIYAKFDPANIHSENLMD
jgi:hypothetical protein